MTSTDSNEKILLVMYDKVSSISNSLNSIIDSIMIVINEDVNKDSLEKISSKVLIEIRSTIDILKEVSIEVPKINETDNTKEADVLFHSSIGSILAGFELLLSWLEDESKEKDNLEKAVDNLFIGAQKMLSLIDKLL